RPPWRTAAAGSNQLPGVAESVLRSSAALEDGRCTVGVHSVFAIPWLRSSAALEDGRCGGPGGHRGLPRSCDPRPPWRTAAALTGPSMSAPGGPLQPSAALEDGRCVLAAPHREERHGCDPRPPWRTAAAADDPDQLLGVPGCDPRPPWR